MLVVCPSWVGDVVMATPTLRMLRERLPGAYIGLLLRPGPDQLLRGTDLADELHVDRAQGVLGPKFVAARLRPRRYDTALLLTNSFSTALIARIAGVPRRIGYERDGRGLLLTRRVPPRKRGDGSWAVVPAVRAYWDVACAMLEGFGIEAPSMPGDAGVLDLPAGAWMELPRTEGDEAAGLEVLGRAGIGAGEAYAVLNPGGNNPAKRWPPERFGAVVRHLFESRGWRSVVNGSPGEAEVCAAVVREAGEGVASDLTACGMSMDALKGVVAGAKLMVTNDTGPRHVAAAFGVATVSLFGPTDHRWTLIPTRPQGPEVILTADPTLPEGEASNDHPDRCRIDRIGVERVIAGVERVLSGRGGIDPDAGDGSVEEGGVVG